MITIRPSSRSFARLACMLLAIWALETLFSFLFKTTYRYIPDLNTFLVFIDPPLFRRRVVTLWSVSATEILYCIGGLSFIGIMIGFWSDTRKAIAFWTIIVVLVILREDMISVVPWTQFRRSTLLFRETHVVIEFGRVVSNGSIVAICALGAYWARYNFLCSASQKAAELDAPKLACANSSTQHRQLVIDYESLQVKTGITQSDQLGKLTIYIAKFSLRVFCFYFCEISCWIDTLLLHYSTTRKLLSNNMERFFHSVNTSCPLF